MSEEIKTSASEGMDPFAASLALSGASRDKADALLKDQRHHSVPPDLAARGLTGQAVARRVEEFLTKQI